MLPVSDNEYSLSSSNMGQLTTVMPPRLEKVACEWGNESLPLSISRTTPSRWECPGHKANRLPRALTLASSTCRTYISNRILPLLFCCQDYHCHNQIQHACKKRQQQWRLMVNRKRAAVTIRTFPKGKSSTACCRQTASIPDQ
jgi:hypothetical protein